LRLWLLDLFGADEEAINRNGNWLIAALAVGTVAMLILTIASLKLG
jgi:hypothetical protein